MDHHQFGDPAVSVIGTVSAIFAIARTATCDSYLVGWEGIAATVPKVQGLMSRDLEMGTMRVDSQRYVT